MPCTVVSIVPGMRCASESLGCCRYNARLKEIELNEDDSVKCFRMADGTTVEGDLYVSAMPGKLSCLGL